MGAPQDDRDEAISTFLYILALAIFFWTVIGVVVLFR